MHKASSAIAACYSGVLAHLKPKVLTKGTGTLSVTSMISLPLLHKGDSWSAYGLQTAPVVAVPALHPWSQDVKTQR
jgi:hypothetical protein